MSNIPAIAFSACGSGKLSDLRAFFGAAMEKTKDFLHKGLESLDEADRDQYWNCAEHNQLIWKSSQEGLVAEWLRRGLQILAPRFDSGRGLH